MNKETTKRRLFLYIIVSYLTVWIPTIVFVLNGGEYDSGAMNFILSYSMLCPALATIFTRFITKEGYGVNGRGFLMLGMNFQNGKWKWYLFAILIPIIYMDLGVGLLYLIRPETFNPGMLESYGITKETLWMYPFVGITSAVVVSIGALGEEIGWRGYMMPKLEELFGLKKAVLIGGIIWGVWHYPMNYAGHNFGTGYWGEPWTGFLAFTIMTVPMGALLTLVTERTESVWPAAFLHAVSNTGANVLSAFYDKEKLSGIWAEPTVTCLIKNIPIILLGIWAVKSMCRGKEIDKSI